MDGFHFETKSIVSDPHVFHQKIPRLMHVCCIEKAYSHYLDR